MLPCGVLYLPQSELSSAGSLLSPHPSTLRFWRANNLIGRRRITPVISGACALLHHSCAASPLFASFTRNNTRGIRLHFLSRNPSLKVFALHALEPGKTTSSRPRSCRTPIPVPSATTSKDHRVKLRAGMKSVKQRNASPETGCLYLVSTPIGNLEDITLRALRILREVDLIACEDTRQTQKLLHHFDFSKQLVSYHEHNEITRAPELVIELEQGAKIALVSDAGTPVLSDPGHHLVALCLRHRIPVIPIPGPSAALAALSVSGLPIGEFSFVGFLPSRAGQRRKALADLRGENRALVLYEAPHRIAETLRDAQSILGDRPAVLAREITKLHEEFLRGTLSQLAESAAKRKPRGEITLIIGSNPESPDRDATEVTTAPAPLAERVAQIMFEDGLDHKAALKKAARERGLAKRDAYRQLLLER